jgi:hypothetical protein
MPSGIRVREAVSLHYLDPLPFLHALKLQARHGNCARQLEQGALKAG